MLIIELVRVGDRLRGRSCSDRFNLLNFGLESIAGDRNQKALKAINRRLAKLGIKLVVVRRALPVWQATLAEALAIGPIALPVYGLAAA